MSDISNLVYNKDQPTERSISASNPKQQGISPKFSCLSSKQFSDQERLIDNSIDAVIEHAKQEFLTKSANLSVTEMDAQNKQLNVSTPTISPNDKNDYSSTQPRDGNIIFISEHGSSSFMENSGILEKTSKRKSDSTILQQTGASFMNDSDFLRQIREADSFFGIIDSPSNEDQSDMESKCNGICNKKPKCKVAEATGKYSYVSPLPFNLSPLPFECSPPQTTKKQRKVSNNGMQMRSVRRSSRLFRNKQRLMKKFSDHQEYEDDEKENAFSDIKGSIFTEVEVRERTRLGLGRTKGHRAFV